MLCLGEMPAFVIFCSRIHFSKDSCYTNQFIDLQWGLVDWFPRVFTDSNFSTERFYPMVWIGDEWEVQMTSNKSLLSPEGLKLRSHLKISSRPAYTGTFLLLLLLKLWMKNHGIWISQHMINNNNINDNNNNDNNPDGIKISSWHSVGDSCPSMSGGIFSPGWWSS